MDCKEGTAGTEATVEQYNSLQSEMAGHRRPGGCSTRGHSPALLPRETVPATEGLEGLCSSLRTGPGCPIRDRFRASFPRPINIQKAAGRTGWLAHSPTCFAVRRRLPMPIAQTLASTVHRGSPCTTRHFCGEHTRNVPSGELTLWPQKLYQHPRLPTNIAQSRAQNTWHPLPNIFGPSQSQEKKNRYIRRCLAQRTNPTDNTTPFP